MKLLKQMHCMSLVLGSIFLSSCLNDDEPEGFYSTLGTVTEVGTNLTLTAC